MAARKPTKRPTTKGFVPAEFINERLDVNQKKAVKEMAWSTDAMDGALEALMVDGYKLTIRWDAKNGCMASWLIAPEGSDHAGYILAGRGSTPSKAIKQLMYIHHVVYEGVWGVDSGGEKDEIDD